MKYIDKYINKYLKMGFKMNKFFLYIYYNDLN